MFTSSTTSVANLTQIYTQLYSRTAMGKTTSQEEWQDLAEIAIRSARELSQVLANIQNVPAPVTEVIPDIAIRGKRKPELVPITATSTPT
ncbi:hypothetical protein, partial [Salmonella enterica]|uniref:hypothetical protein n=1 Tax=Salmonella enterica TaxID=28901 RepID=UPI0021B30306